MQPFTGWPPEALEWLRGIEANNNREWFQAHKKTYEEAVRGPLEAFLEEVREEFGDAKVFRPNRDTRFSADKSPYKTRIYAAVYDPSRGSWYVMLDKEGIFSGGGLYSPDREHLDRVRAAIADDSTGPELERAVEQMESNGVELMTEGSLKTAPRGYSVDHPRIRLLRLPHLAAGMRLEAGPWLHTAEAKERILQGWRGIAPLLDWLSKAV